MKLKRFSDMINESISSTISFINKDSVVVTEGGKERVIKLGRFLKKLTNKRSSDIEDAIDRLSDGKYVGKKIKLGRLLKLSFPDATNAEIDKWVRK